MSLIDITTEIGKSIIALVDAKTGGAPDKETIVSSDGKVSAVGVKESNNNKAIKTWVGTLEEYEALEAIDDNTLYTITDDIEGDEVFTTTKVNLDGSNYVGSGLSNVVEETHWNTKITNCITEIPQRIKYTLVDGTLTILKGSVVIVPYGVEDKTAEFPVGARFLHDDFKVYDTQFADGKFFVWAEFVNDSSSSRAVTDSLERFLNVFITVDTHVQAGLSNSSGTEPIKNHMIYNPETNLIQYYENSDAMTVLCDVCALPWGRCKANGTNVFGHILEIYNGVMYIGGTIVIDKGIKGLAPNGKSPSGELINKEYTLKNIIVRTWESNTSTTDFCIGINDTSIVFDHCYYFCQSHEPLNSHNCVWLNPDTNLMRSIIKYSNQNKDTTGKGVLLFRAHRTAGVIDWVKVNTPEVLTRANLSEITSYAMPSEKYIDLTLGATGTNYIAPANGWFHLMKKAVNGGEFVYLGSRNGNALSFMEVANTNHKDLRVSLPVRKGDTINIQWSSTGDLVYFRFIYAQGEV